ncbi:MAG: alpha/beta hydrolase [Alphaproteobacteria bacterium]|nr:alpha/beta hydrolase [Alphaproteobacteria bacterium]
MPLAELPAVRINYLQMPAEDEAPAPEDVVMVHGLATNMAFWYGGLAPVLTRFARVTIYDLRGHGHSSMPPSGYSPVEMAEDLRLLLDHLGIESAHMVAHSFGGMVAVIFALSHPERVKSLVLADVRLRPVQPRLRLRQWRFAPRWHEALAEAGVTLDDDHPDSGILLLTELARLTVERPDDARRLNETFFGAEGRLGTRTARRWLNMLETTSAFGEITGPGPDFHRDDLKRLTQPILALVGEHSIAKASARVLKRECPNCVLRVIPGAGHFFPLSRRQLFARLCLRFYAAQAGWRPELGTRH